MSTCNWMQPFPSRPLRFIARKHRNHLLQSLNNLRKINPVRRVKLAMSLELPSSISGDLNLSFNGNMRTSDDEISVEYDVAEEANENGNTSIENPVLCNCDIQLDEDCEIYYKDGTLYGNDGIPAMWKHVTSWLTVPTELIFSTDKYANLFLAKIKLKNTSPLFITYMVATNTRGIFKMAPSCGALSPKHDGEVIVTSIETLTLNQDEVVKDILKAQFCVYATPIYFSHQLHPKKIKLLWKVYGTDLFPKNTSESHTIRKMIIENDACMDKFSIFDRIPLYNYINRKDDSTVKIFRPRASPIEKEKFLETWMPDDPENYKKFANQQMEHMSASMENMKEDLDSSVALSKLTCCFVLGTFLIIFISRYWQIIHDFGANGPWLDTTEKQDKPKSTLSWW